MSLVDHICLQNISDSTTDDLSKLIVEDIRRQNLRLIARYKQILHGLDCIDDDPRVHVLRVLLEPRPEGSKCILILNE